MPDAPTSDTVGPMTRTVRDAAIVLGVIAGPDSNDPATVAGEGRLPASYTEGLSSAGLQGARLGVIRSFFGTGAEADKVTSVIDAAIADLQRLGATVIDPVEILHAETILAHGSTTWGRWNYENGDALDAYLTGLGDIAPVAYEELRDIGSGAPLILPYTATGGMEKPEYRSALAESTEYTREAVQSAMAEHNLDALVYPTLSMPPARIGKAQTGSNCHLSAWSGYPAITVPAGYTVDAHPVGLELLSTPWTEAALLTYAYAFELGTQHRRAPELAPGLG